MADYYAAGRSFTGPQNGFAIAGDYLSAASFLGFCVAITVNGYDGFLCSIVNLRDREICRTVIVIGILAIIGGIGAQGQNIAFLVALAFAVAASANLPTILYSLRSVIDQEPPTAHTSGVPDVHRSRSSR